MKKKAPIAKHDQEDLRFQAVHAQQLSQFLRQWSGHILGQIEDEEQKVSIHMFLEEHILEAQRRVAPPS